jgi:hypothetical protein
LALEACLAAVSLNLCRLNRAQLNRAQLNRAQCNRAQLNRAQCNRNTPRLGSCLPLALGPLGKICCCCRRSSRSCDRGSLPP